MERLKEHQKVFGLGLNRTGTTSLGCALNTLGIKTIHYPYDERTYNELTQANYKLSVLKQYQGIVDIPVAPYYAQLDKIYPESKFILTIRDKASWLRSIQNLWSRMLKHYNRDVQFRQFTEFIVAVVYGSLHYNEERFLYVYDTHVQNVCAYFDNRMDDFLIIDICGGDGWEKLCTFLGLRIPDALFPHVNKTEDDQIDLAMQDISTVISPGNAFILVDDATLGDDVLSGWRAIPFLERDGQYWGRPPDDITAICELERLRKSGVSFMVFAWEAFWWLDYYTDLHRYLRSKFRCVLENGRLVVFKLGA